MAAAMTESEYRALVIAKAQSMANECQVPVRVTVVLEEEELTVVEPQNVHPRTKLEGKALEGGSVTQ